MNLKNREKKKEMLFSIIIPVYNVEKYLLDCLNSIIPQVYKNEHKIEVLLIDDGSTDNSGKICDEMAKQNSDFVKVFHKKNEGLLQTRRYGFKNAKGKYIINCDSDDLLTENALQELTDIVTNTDVDVVIYNIDLLKDSEDREIFYQNVFSNNELSAVEKKDVLDTFFLTEYNIASMCCKCFKRDCLDLNIDYLQYGKLSLGEDSMQSAEIYTKATSFIYYNKSLYCYRIGTGMMASFNNNYFTDAKKVINHIIYYMKKNGYTINTEEEAVKCFNTVGHAVIQTRFDKTLTLKQRKDIIQKIENDDYFIKHIQHFNLIKNKLKFSHKIICSLIMKQKYLLIDIILRLKNIL